MNARHGIPLAGNRSMRFVSGVFLLCLLCLSNAPSAMADQDVVGAESSAPMTLEQLEANFVYLGEQVFNDPYHHYDEQLKQLRARPEVRRLVASGQHGARLILDLLSQKRSGWFTTVAVIVLAEFESRLFYEDLLEILASVERRHINTYRRGLYMIKVPMKRLARDLMDLVLKHDNPDLLLLLRMESAEVVAPELLKLLLSGRKPFNELALYCLHEAATKDEIPALHKFMDNTDNEEFAARAGLILLRLDEPEGFLGVEVGLTSTDSRLRSRISTVLRYYTPFRVRRRARYRSIDTAEKRHRSLVILRAHFLGPDAGAPPPSPP